MSQDDFDNKKWIVERIENNIQTQLNFKDKGEKEFEQFMDNEVKAHKDVQKVTLSIVVFLTTLILGLASISIDWVNVESSLFIIFLIGSIVYGITVLFKFKNNLVLQEVYSMIHKGQAAIFYPKGFIQGKSVDLDTQSAEDYKIFYYYLADVIEPALDLPGYFAVKKAKKSLVLSKPGRKGMQRWETYYEKSLKKGIENFKKDKKKYEASPITKPLIRFGELLLEYENGEEPDIGSVMQD